MDTRTLLPALLLFASLTLADPAKACGPDSDCEVENGTYRIHLPPGDAPDGAILFAHGYRGTAAGTMGNGALMAMADELNVALVALQSYDRDWTIPGSPQEGKRPARDEVAYAVRVKDDVVARFRVDPERTMMAGFSAGGMLAWNVACEAGGDFAAVVPFSGTFWGGPPAACPANASIWHFHGTSDTVVPISGRAIGPTRQGDVNAVLEMYRADKGLQPAAPVPIDDLDCARWADAEASLEYCRHPGGHMFRTVWLRDVWNATFP